MVAHLTSTMTERLCVESHGPDEEAAKRAFRHAYQFAKKHGANLLLLTPGNAQLEGGVIYGILGDKAARALLREEEVVLNGLTIAHASERTYGGYGKEERVVFCAYPNNKLLDKAEAGQPPAIVVLPWHRDDGKEWAQQYGATTEGSGAATVPGLDPVVERALESLTGYVNLSTGLSHPDDKLHAKETFLILRRAGYALDDDGIRSWASRNGWKPDDSRDLAEMATQVNEGKWANLPIKSWRADILETWKGKPFP